MPRKASTSKRPTTRRYNNNNKRRYRPKTSMLTRPAPRVAFHTKQLVKFEYYQTYYYNGESGSVHVAQIQLNSLYSPEGSQTLLTRLYSNAQPYYFDQITPVYDNYVVYKARVDATIVCSYTINGAGNSYPPQCQAVLRDNSDNSTLPSSIQLEMCRPNCVYKVSHADIPIRLSKTWHINKLGGETVAGYIDEPANWGTSGASPTNIYYANVCIQRILHNFIPTITIKVTQWAQLKGLSEQSMS